MHESARRVGYPSDSSWLASAADSTRSLAGAARRTKHCDNTLDQKHSHLHRGSAAHAAGPVPSRRADDPTRLPAQSRASPVDRSPGGRSHSTAKSKSTRRPSARRRPRPAVCSPGRRSASRPPDSEMRHLADRRLVVGPVPPTVLWAVLPDRRRRVISRRATSQSRFWFRSRAGASPWVRFSLVFATALDSWERAPHSAGPREPAGRIQDPAGPAGPR